MLKIEYSEFSDKSHSTIVVDITAPLYWWKEFEQYKVGKVLHSRSIMTKIQSKELTLDDFSYEHLFDRYGDPSMNLNYAGKYPKAMLVDSIHALNSFRDWFIQTKDKRYWWQIIQLLPSSYNQERTILLDYEILADVYPELKDRYLDEWHDFCDWSKNLPNNEVIIGKE